MQRLDLLWNAVEYIRAHVNKEFAMPQLSIFLHVCRHEGISMTQLCRDLDMPQGSVSRNVKWLGRFYDGDQPMGYDLIRTEFRVEKRQQSVLFLTPRGKEVGRELILAMTSRS